MDTNTDDLSEDEVQRERISRLEDAERKAGNPTPLLGALMADVFGGSR